MKCKYSSHTHTRAHTHTLKMVMLHDYMIRNITKYLYRDNKNLVNLVAMNSRFNGIRKIFLSNIEYVSIEITEENKAILIFNGDTIQYILRVHPSLHHLNTLVNLQNCLFQQANDTSQKYININVPIHYEFMELLNLKLSRKIYAKQLAECISKIIEKYDNGIFVDVAGPMGYLGQMGLITGVTGSTGPPGARGLAYQ